MEEEIGVQLVVCADDSELLDKLDHAAMNHQLENTSTYLLFALSIFFVSRVLIRNSLF